MVEEVVGTELILELLGNHSVDELVRGLAGTDLPLLGTFDVASCLEALLLEVTMLDEDLVEHGQSGLVDSLVTSWRLEEVDDLEKSLGHVFRGHDTFVAIIDII